MKKLSFFILFLAMLMTGAAAHAATYYVCDTGSACLSGSSNTDWVTGNDGNACTSRSTACKTLRGGITRMSSGDTLVIGNGTYRGSNQYNYINPYLNVLIPGGSANAYTTVRAENDGGVTIDPADLKSGGYKAFEMAGTSSQIVDPAGFSVDYNTSGISQSYIIIRGIVQKGPIYLSAVDHVKFINVGAYDAGSGNVAGISANFSKYVLFEGCYAWGSSRAKFMLFHAHYTIVRNCVARQDYVDVSADNGGAGDPMSVMDDYSSFNNEWQNNIVIDSDQGANGKYVGFNEDAGALANANTSASIYEGQPVYWRQNIVFNSSLKFASSDLHSSRMTNPIFDNCLGWNIHLDAKSSNNSNLGDNAIVRSFGTAVLNQCTFGSINKGSYGSGNYQQYFNGYGGKSPHTITNSILYKVGSGDPLFYAYTAKYLNLFSTGTADGGGSSSISNTVTTNPTSNGLLYPVRIETSGSLNTAGGGSRVGANIVYQYGAPGSLYGESGYNLLQNGTNGQATVLMWPFPNEAIIKAKMAAYNSNGVNGARGFCTGTSLDGTTQTLTKYIWEALGNPIPSSIYAGGRSDDGSGGSDGGGQSSSLSAPSGLRVVQ